MSDLVEIQDYVDAASAAARRTRFATVTLVIGSVLMFSGLLNSLQSAWMLKRMLLLGDQQGRYVQSKIGPYPQRPWVIAESVSTYDHDIKSYEYRYQSLCSAVARAYVETSLLVHVPFFGINIDVNDLGLVGGISFVIILLCYRFCVSREVENLRLSFAEAARLRLSPRFYEIMAMNQVFTIPRTKYRKRTPFLHWTPKCICWCPLVVYAGVIANDVHTNWIGRDLGEPRLAVLFVSEALLATIIVTLSIMVTTRLQTMDQVWDEAWAAMDQEEGPSQGAPTR